MNWKMGPCLPTVAGNQSTGIINNSNAVVALRASEYIDCKLLTSRKLVLKSWCTLFKQDGLAAYTDCIPLFCTSFVVYTISKASNASESTPFARTRVGAPRRRSELSSCGKQKKTSGLRILCLNFKDVRPIRHLMIKVSMLLGYRIMWYFVAKRLDHIFLKCREQIDILESKYSSCLFKSNAWTKTTKGRRRTLYILSFLLKIKNVMLFGELTSCTTNSIGYYSR